MSRTPPTPVLQPRRRMNWCRGSSGCLRCSNMAAKIVDERGGCNRLHECFSDEHGMGPGGTHARGVGARGNAALAHRDDFAGKMWNQPFAQRQVGLEGGEVAVD